MSAFGKCALLERFQKYIESLYPMDSTGYSYFSLKAIQVKRTVGE